MGELFTSYSTAVKGKGRSRLGVVGEARHQIEQLVPDDLSSLPNLARAVRAVLESELVAGLEGGMTFAGRH
jgi:hypothetical protein